MKKILMIMLSLSLLVGCSNKTLDDTVSNEISTDISDDTSVVDNEDARIRANEFPALYIPDVDYSIDFDEDGTYFKSVYGDHDAYIIGVDDDNGNVEISMRGSNYYMNESEYYLDGLVKYISDSIGTDVSKDIKDKINSYLEEYQTMYLTQGEQVWLDNTTIFENDIVTLTLQAVVSEHHDPDDDSMLTIYDLELINKENSY